MQETLEQLVARINRMSFIPPPEPTARIYPRDDPKPQKQEKAMTQKIKLGKGKEFTFKSPLSAGGDSKYPWDEWFSGDLLLVEQSVGVPNDKGTIVDPTEKKDFEVSVDAMPAKLKTAARRRYKVVQISRFDADGTKLKNALIIRTRDMDADERAAEDLLRAEEKEENAERRAERKVTAGGHLTTTTTAEESA